jgi:hypothetical protein
MHATCLSGSEKKVAKMKEHGLWIVKQDETTKSYFCFELSTGSNTLPSKKGAK